MTTPMRPAEYLAVAAGGALGSLSRYCVSAAWLAGGPSGFPWPTLVVNVAGSILVGLFAARALDPEAWLARPGVRLFLVAGFCGGLTTFSFFSLELAILFQEARWRAAGIYLVVSLVAWLLAVALGFRIGRRQAWRSYTKSQTNQE